MRDHILSALRHALLARGPLEHLPEPVWKRASAFNTWGTNAIEGNTLARPDVERLLLEEHVAAGSPLRDVLETTQHDHAFRRLPRRLAEPLTARMALDLHEEVFHRVKPHAGTWRLVRVGIAGTAFVPPRPEEVPIHVDAWEREYHQRDLRGEDALDLAAWMHQRFESIHPFLDGNGRVGRLLLNFHLLKHNWPPLHLTPDDKDRYVAAIESGHSEDLAPLRRLFAEAIARSALDLLDQVGSVEDELRPLSELARESGHSAKYLALRASQGALPALKSGRAWRTSRRAIRLYAEHVSQ